MRLKMHAFGEEISSKAIFQVKRFRYKDRLLYMHTYRRVAVRRLQNKESIAMTTVETFQETGWMDEYSKAGDAATSAA